MTTILAYFDPGSGSLLAQALVGGVAGLAVFGKYIWMAAVDRFRNLERQTFGPDMKSLSTASSGEIPIMP